jgi:hypothetical protein
MINTNNVQTKNNKKDKDVHEHDAGSQSDTSLRTKNEDQKAHKHTIHTEKKV